MHALSTGPPKEPRLREASSGSESSGEPNRAWRRVFTVPNALSALRILSIPVFVTLLLREETRLLGFLLLAAVVSTDWIDGYVARRTGRVTLLGSILDPLADRLALGAALVTFVAVDAIPLWAALVLLVRDAVVLLAGAAAAVARGIRIEVRRMGKYATFTLWWAVGLIAWGNLGFLLDDVARVLGWTWFAVGVVEYYVVTVVYAADLRRELSGAKRRRSV